MLHKNSLIIAKTADLNGEFAVVLKTECYQSSISENKSAICLAVARTQEEAKVALNKWVEEMQNIPSTLQDVRQTHTSEFLDMMSLDWRTYNLKPEFTADGVEVSAHYRKISETEVGTLTTRVEQDGRYVTYLDGSYSNGFINLCVLEYSPDRGEGMLNHRKWEKIFENPPLTIKDVCDEPMAAFVHNMSAELGRDTRTYHLATREVGMEMKLNESTEFGGNYITIIRGAYTNVVGSDICVLESYQTKEEADAGYEKWKQLFSTNPPLELKDVMPTDPYAREVYEQVQKRFDEDISVYRLDGGKSIAVGARLG